MKRLLAAAVSFSALFAAAPAAWPQSAAENIRVAVAQNEAEVALKIRGRYTLTSLDTGEAIHSARRLDKVAVRATEAGLSLGDQAFAVKGLRVESQRDAAIDVNGRHLRGTIEITRQPNQKLRVINYVPLEDYLRGVLSKEAPDYWPKEALRAIAIAARTYAVYQRLIKSGDAFDVRADVLSQDYGGKSSEKLATSRAVTDTAGWILVYEGKVFPSFYHSTCGGMTENGRVMGKFDLPPLAGGITCRYCSGSPFFSWQRRLSRADVAWALHKSPHGSIGAIKSFEVTKRTPSQRVEQAIITGAQRSLKLTGYDIRALFGFDRIRSPLFTVTENGDGFVLDGHGWGHGVGLCQWGASELARRGMPAAEILAYYYRGAQLVQLEALGDAIAPIAGES